MSNIEDPKSVLTEVWARTASEEPSLDEDCSPTKQCRNMKDITFDGYAPEGTDMRAAWKNLLALEGKLNPSAETIRDLVLGADAPNDAQ